MSSVLRVHFFQHIRGEGVGSLAAWLHAWEAEVTCTPFYDIPQGQGVASLPNPDEVDLLIIMGGAMSVNDEALYPWLVEEKAWIRTYIAKQKPVVGLCLGAQLIANALGAAVRTHIRKEIGWWPVFAIEQPIGQTFVFPSTLCALSWHGDTFDLPQGATLLARSAACEHQAYQYGQHVLAFQFHPESTPDNLKLFLSDIDYQDFAGDDLYIQPPDVLRQTATDPARFVPANMLLERAVEFVLHASTLSSSP